MAIPAVAITMAGADAFRLFSLFTSPFRKKRLAKKVRAYICKLSEICYSIIVIVLLYKWALQFMLTYCGFFIYDFVKEYVSEFK